MLLERGTDVSDETIRHLESDSTYCLISEASVNFVFSGRFCDNTTESHTQHEALLVDLETKSAAFASAFCASGTSS